MHVAVIVLAGPDIATVPLEGAGHHIVDQTMLISQTGRFVLTLVLRFEDLGEDVLELTIVCLENRVLGG